MDVIKMLEQTPLPRDVSEGKKASQTHLLLEICKDVEFFHTAESEAFATVAVEGHRETWALRSSGFKDWLRHQYYKSGNGSPNSNAMQDALATFEAQARFDGRELEVYLRVARADENIYVDLCDSNWRVVEISKRGWKVLDVSPVKFRRPKGMLALPTPIEVDPIEYIGKLRAHLNVESDDGSDDNFKLVLAFIMSAFMVDGPFPVLVPYGEQGTGKSTLVRMIRSLVDPNSSPLRREPRTPDDLMVSARSNWIVAFDNVSRLSDDMSDDICRLSTGGGLSKRELFTNDGEIVLNAKRPCILNGIEEFVSRGDLADRSIILSLPVIPEEKRAREEKFFMSFEADRPGIFSALCSAISIGLQNKDSFELKKKPRMADAFHWVTATETAFGWDRESTLAAYFRNQKMANEIVLASSPLFKHISKYAQQQFKGTAAQLLENIKSDAAPSELKYLPSNAISLGNKLRRLAPAMNRAGIEMSILRSGHERRIELRYSSKNVVTAVIAAMPSTRFAPASDTCDNNDDIFTRASGGN